MARGPRISPRLFDIPIDFVERVVSGEIKLAGEATMTSPIVVFAQNFYLQFFEKVIGHPITAVNTAAKRDSVVARHALRKQNAPRELLQLLTWFEYFCDIRPDLDAAGYVERTIEFRDFLTGEFRTLVDRIHKWARREDLDDVAAKTAELRKLLRRVT